MRTKLINVVVVLLAVFLLTSCSYEAGRSIESARINDDGELILTYTDGSKDNLGVVTGQDGADGQDGKDGADGTAGNGGSVTLAGTDSNISLATARALRSAVSIHCNFTATVKNPWGGYYPGFGGGGGAKQEYSSAGSGVLYKVDKELGNAFIITNYHVVYDSSSDTENGISEEITVYLYGSETEAQGIPAVYVGGSLYYDIAVLYIEDSDLIRTSLAAGVTVADSDQVCPGDTAIAVGNPEDMGISASVGIVSVDSEYITMTAADERTSVSFRVMRIDTAVNSGNSGGGLFNHKGELMGIVNAKVSDTSVENIGYAIPSAVAVSVAENILDHCFGTEAESVQRGSLGITVSVSDSLAAYEEETGRITIEETVSVYEVDPRGIAYGVLQAGDVLRNVTVGETLKEITRQHHVIDLMLDVRAGDTVTFTLLRDGEELTVQIAVAAEDLISY